jgi:hypothetical protein
MEILISNDWQLNQLTGSDIVRSILKLSSNDYDFSKITNLVDSKAMEYLFKEKASSLGTASQSSVFLCFLKEVCEE